MDSTGAVIFFGLVAVVLLGVAGYYYGFPSKEARGEAWERAKANHAIDNQRVAEARATREREQRTGIEVAASPQMVLDAAVEMMTREGWAAQHRSETTVSFARDEGADAGVGCLLLLFFLVPGILYFALANKTVRMTIAAYPHEGGSRVVAGGDHQLITGDLVRHLRDLPAPGQAPVTPGVEGAGYTQPSIAEKLRQLSEARDAGLLTQEEFEAKKRDLIDSL